MEIHECMFWCVCEFLSRGSSGRERNDKPLSVGPTRTGPILLGSSNKEAPEESVQEVSRRDSYASDTPKLPASTADKSRLERSQSRESGEPHRYHHTHYDTKMCFWLHEIHLEKIQN